MSQDGPAGEAPRRGGRPAPRARDGFFLCLFIPSKFSVSESRLFRMAFVNMVQTAESLVGERGRLYSLKKRGGEFQGIQLMTPRPRPGDFETVRRVSNCFPTPHSAPTMKLLFAVFLLSVLPAIVIARDFYKVGERISRASRCAFALRTRGHTAPQSITANDPICLPPTPPTPRTLPF
jgi:hypothetical protein